MTLQEFKKKYLGKQVEYHSYSVNAKFQCVDLANQYIVEVLKLTPIIGTNACDFVKKYNKNEFEYIPNTPEGVPSEGDIPVWSNKVGGGAGHIAIALSGDTNKFISLDQNWSKPLYVTEESHTYKNLLGWLKPLKISTDMKPTEKLPKEFYEIREFKQLKERKLVEGTEAFDTLMALLLAENTHRNDAVNELQKQINLFEEQKKGWEETKKDALESQKKDYENKIYGMSETIADLQAQVQDKPVVINTPPTSAKWNFNTKDLVAWLKNIGLFGMLPLVITLLVSFTGEIPTNTIYGVIGLALLNALIDFIKKLLKDNGSTDI